MIRTIVKGDNGIPFAKDISTHVARWWPSQQRLGLALVVNSTVEQVILGCTSFAVNTTPTYVSLTQEWCQARTILANRSLPIPSTTINGRDAPKLLEEYSSSSQQRSNIQ
jgi:hypothetical protein